MRDRRCEKEPRTTACMSVGFQTVHHDSCDAYVGAGNPMSANVNRRHAEAEVGHRAEVGCGEDSSTRGRRTFLAVFRLEQRRVDCRDAKGASWVGRSPLLGSIVRCRPKS